MAKWKRDAENRGGYLASEATAWPDEYPEADKSPGRGDYLTIEEVKERLRQRGIPVERIYLQ